MALPVPEAGSPRATLRGLAPAYPWFAAGVGSWFGAWGLQQVLFAWLVVGELRAPPEWVGVAQTSSMLPAVFLLLVGGAAADRRDPRRLLIVLHAAAALPALALAAAVAGGWLGLPGLVAYGLCMGTIMAFSIPARDSLLSRVAGDDVMRAVTGATIAQFGSQAIGTLAAGAARWVGSPLMLGVQAAVMGLGAWATARLPPAAPLPRAASGASPLREVTEGLRFVLRSPLRAVLILLCGVGVLFMGPFLVVFPLLVRDVYGGDVSKLSLVLMLFPVGTITGSLWLLARGGVRRKGRALLLALASGGLALVVIGQGLPYPGFLAMTLCWGLGGAVFMNCSRTLFQKAAPEGVRGRVLAVNQLGFMAAAPLGTLLSGVVSAAIGPLDTLVVGGGAMMVLVAGVALLSDVARME